MQSYQLVEATTVDARENSDADIVRLHVSNFTIASEHLSAAFSQDPLISYYMPRNAAAKQKTLKHLGAAFLNFARLYGHIYTTAGEPKGVAIWLPPEAANLTFAKLRQAFTSGLAISPIYLPWTRIIDFLVLMYKENQLHHQLCPEPHWYLGMLGVSPQCQGQGIGGKLLQPVLAEADSTQLPCYLETTTTSAVRFYQRQGFEVVYQDRFADRDFWAMKRYPKHRES
ncbi:MAG: GNAT family N-acetyltransferase [Cyanobacteria bacterium P01_H01_bin.15]